MCIRDRSKEQLAHERELHEANTARAEAQRKAEQERSSRERTDEEREAESETLDKIREELAELRAHLEVLTGRELGYEPAALRAQARRIMELETESGGEGQAPPVKGAPSAAAVTGLLGQTPKEPLRRQDIATAEEAPSSATKGAKEDAKEDATSTTRTFDTGSFTSVKWDQVGARHVADTASDSRSGKTATSTGDAATGKTAGEKKASGEKKAAEKATDSVKQAEPKPSGTKPAESRTPAEEAEAGETAEEQDRRGRRRADERRDSVSVADLLANLKKDEK